MINRREFVCNAAALVAALPLGAMGADTGTSYPIRVDR